MLDSTDSTVSFSKGAATSRALSEAFMALERTPEGLGTGTRSFLEAMLHQPASEAGDLSGALAARFWEAINQTLAEWMITGQDALLWDAVGEIRRAVRDFMRQRGGDPSTLEPVDLHAAGFRAVADFLEAHLQPASVSSAISRLSGARYVSWVETLKVLLDDPKGAIRPEGLVERGIYGEDKAESAAKALRLMVSRGLLAKRSHGEAYRLTFLGRRVAQAMSEEEGCESPKSEGTGSDSSKPPPRRRGNGAEMEKAALETVPGQAADLVRAGRTAPAFPGDGFGNGDLARRIAKYLLHAVEDPNHSKLTLASKRRKWRSKKAAAKFGSPRRARQRSD